MRPPACSFPGGCGLASTTPWTGARLTGIVPAVPGPGSSRAGMPLELRRQRIAWLQLGFAPEFDVLGVLVGSNQPETEEIEGRPEAGMGQHAEHPLALARAEPGLQQPYLLHRQR